MLNLCTMSNSPLCGAVEVMRQVLATCKAPKCTIIANVLGHLVLLVRVLIDRRALGCRDREVGERNDREASTNIENTR